MARASHKEWNVIVELPEPSTKKKKGVNKKDNLTQEDEIQTTYHGPSANQAQAIASEMPTSDTSSRAHPVIRASNWKPRESRFPEKIEGTSKSVDPGHESLLQEEKAKIEDLKAKRAATNKKNRERSKSQTALKAEVRTLKEALKMERGSSTTLQKEVNEKNKLVARYQEESARMKRKGAVDSIDDNQLNVELRDVRMLCQNFVSENAVATLNGIPSHFTEHVLEMGMPSHLSLGERQQVFAAFVKEPGATVMLLGILLSYVVFEPVLDHPFVFFDSADIWTKTGLQRVLDHGLRRMYHLSGEDSARTNYADQETRKWPIHGAR